MASEMIELVNAHQLSKMINFSVRTIQKWVQEEKIPHYRMGYKAIRFNPSEIKKWLESKHIYSRPRIRI